MPVRAWFCFSLVALLAASFADRAVAVPNDCSTLDGNHYIRLADRGPGQRVRGYLCFVVRDDPDLQGVLTLKHIVGRGNWDVLVGTDFDPETRRVHGTIGYQNNTGTVDELVWLPGSSGRNYVVVAYPTSDIPSQACLIFHRVDADEIAGKAFLMATAHSILVELFSNEDDTQAKQADTARVIAGGLSALHRSNLALVGYDLVLNEISTQLAETFGGGTWLFAFGVNYFGGYLEESGRFLFDSEMRCDS